MSRLCYFPMGQQPVALKEQHLKVLAALKKEWTLKEVPSFEVWVAATCFDPNFDDGGEIFQQMMFHVMTEDRAEAQLEKGMKAWQESTTQKFFADGKPGKGFKRKNDVQFGKVTNYARFLSIFWYVANSNLMNLAR